jgi:hypothetical protein
MSRELIRVCCVCLKTEDKGVWDKHPHLEKKKRNDNTTHGYCPPCFKEQMRDMHNDGSCPDHRFDI